jgi:hypothetical protein
MSDFQLIIGGNNAEIVGGDISWDMSGQYYRTMTYTDRKKIETTIATTGSGVTSTATLKKNYDATLEASWTPALSLTDTKYSQVYTRYYLDPNDSQYAVWDAGISGGDPYSPLGFRKFMPTLVREYTLAPPAAPVAVDDDEQQPYGFLKRGTSWTRLKESGFLFGFENEENAPSVYFKSKAATTSINKANPKSATIALKGFSRITSYDTSATTLTTTDYMPTTVMLKDQFRYEDITNSRRSSPSSAATTADGIYDYDEMQSYTTTISERNAQNNITTNLVLDGDFEIQDADYITGPNPLGLRAIKMGDRLTTIKMVEGVTIIRTLNINLPVIDVDFAPNMDQTTISVGRV